MTFKAEGGGLAQWLGRRISEQRVPGSSLGRAPFVVALNKSHSCCLVLVKHRKQWTDDRHGQTVTKLETTLCLLC